MSTTFTTPFEQYADRDGQEVTILHIFTEPDEEHDEEVLPMVLVRFPDGFEAEAWPEELTPCPVLGHPHLVSVLCSAARRPGIAWMGVREFRLVSTTHYDDYDEQAAYDSGRELAHMLTGRRYDH